MADLANEEKPAIAPPVFVFQKDKGQKSSAEQKDLSDSGEEPRGEAEAPHHGTGHPESAGEHALEPPAPASASASTPEAQLLPFPRELAGRPAGGSSPEGGEDSDREDGNYCPPVKRERTSSLTQFPPSQSEEKSSGFRLKPPTLIHGQAPSAGLPSQKPKEQQRSVLRPAVLQAPQPKALSQTGKKRPGTRAHTVGCRAFLRCVGGSCVSSEGTSAICVECAPEQRECWGNDPLNPRVNGGGSERETQNPKQAPGSELSSQSPTRGSNSRTLIHENTEVADMENAGHPSSETPTATNYFLQYISSRCVSWACAQLQEGPVVLHRPSLRTQTGDSTGGRKERGGGFYQNPRHTPPASPFIPALGTALQGPGCCASTDTQGRIQASQCPEGAGRDRWVEERPGQPRSTSTSAVQPQAVRAPGEDGPRGSRGFRPLSLSLSAPDTAWGCGGSQPNPEALQPTASLRLSQASSKDTGQLYAALHHRILALRSRVEQEQEAKMPAPEPGAAPSNEDDSDEDVLAPSGATGGGAGDEGDGQTAGST
ncbi:ran-binding protein 3 isoform ranbp3-d [Lynx pardinus]|uniref:Ran-binding protein 3 isoform ranbp3-d n=1 Tax=Lynx pardinus TaxID=191816 RepID=A0A485PTE5_LYNPA|nr:ran-binding protein 3 isoform ranbp3-d [Lynx pardinus]